MYAFVKRHRHHYQDNQLGDAIDHVTVNRVNRVNRVNLVNGYTLSTHNCRNATLSTTQSPNFSVSFTFCKVSLKKVLSEMVDSVDTCTDTNRKLLLDKKIYCLLFSTAIEETIKLLLHTA